MPARFAPVFVVHLKMRQAPAILGKFNIKRCHCVIFREVKGAEAFQVNMRIKLVCSCKQGEDERGEGHLLRIGGQFWPPLSI